MSVMSNWCQTDKQRRRKFAKKPTTSALRVLWVLRAMWQNDEIYQGKCHESFKRISKAIQDEELGHSIQNSSDTGVLSVALGRTLQSWRDSIEIQQAKEATCLRPYQEFREWHLEIGIAAFLIFFASFWTEIFWSKLHLRSVAIDFFQRRAGPGQSTDILRPSANVRCVYFKILSSSISVTHCRWVFCSIQAHLSAKRWSAGQMHVALWDFFQIDGSLACKRQ